MKKIIALGAALGLLGVAATASASEHFLNLKTNTFDNGRSGSHFNDGNGDGFPGAVQAPGSGGPGKGGNGIDAGSVPAMLSVEPGTGARVDTNDLGGAAGAATSAGNNN